MRALKLTLLALACILGATLAGRIEDILSKEKLPKITIKPITRSSERIQSHGYPVEEHEVETEDGYVLTLFRIPYSPKLKNKKGKRPAVLLQHGLLSNSDSWLSSGPENSLAYLLVDAGYDVWLGNARGNTYSRENTRMSTSHYKYWHFDWHEIGTIDIAAMIDYILDKTGQKSLHYAGHSQGTTVYFVLMSERPEYNAKIKSAHMLAPCAFFGAGTNFVFDLFQPLVGNPGSIWNQFFVDMELIPYSLTLSRLAGTSCGLESQYEDICKNVFVSVANGGYQNTNLTSLSILVETHPGGASMNQGIHYIQMYESSYFRQYDWGVSTNRKIYNQDTPPDYDLSRITAPTHLYSSTNDGLCAPRDVDRLVENMPQLAEDHRIPLQSFNHLDFIVANNMKELVNDLIVDRMNSYEKKR